MKKTTEVLTVGQELYGFKVKRVRELPAMHQHFYELEHLATGARWVHLANDDTNNFFGVIVKTIPVDSTGVPHILEHTVLCGSKKFPVKDPFFGMIRRSLNTFMNAMTWPDRTGYPFGSQNEKDFYNLMDVYLDAVFYSRISRLHFMQEGWRAEFDEKGELEYKGVVYNEMKGSLSSPTNVLLESLGHALFPTTTYGYNSGGDPADIPKLTHEQLQGFYRRFYHPANSWFYSYGDMPLSKHLEFVTEKVLRHFDRIDPQTEIGPEPQWTEPKNATYYYPLAKNEDPEKKHQVALGWLTASVDDSFEILLMQLLETILLGDAAAPLRKALIDSGLGSSLTPSGLDADRRQAVFLCGLKDVKAGDAPEIERLIISTLEKLAREGIDKESIASALHQLEFRCREISRGLSMMFIMSAAWIHGGDPLDCLDYEKNLENLRRELASGQILENRIKKYLLDNPHRVLLTLSPDQGLAEKREERVKKELADLRSRLTPADEERIRRETAELAALQDGPDDLSCLPDLAIADIPPRVKRTAGRQAKSLPNAVRYLQPTNGIFSFQAFWEIKNVPEALWPLLPLFCRVVTGIGTKKTNYAEWARQISAHTGGIRLDISAYPKKGAADNCLPLVELETKCLARNRETMFSLLEELLCEYSFTDLERLKTILLEYGSYFQEAVVGSGHHYAVSLAARGFSRANALNETWHGVHHYQTIRKLIDNLTQETLEILSRDLGQIGWHLIDSGWHLALIGEKSDLDRAISRAKELQSRLPSPARMIAYGSRPPFQPERFREGWSIAADCAFVASAFKTVDYFHPDAPTLAVIGHLLKGLFIHREIREKGGAYGGHALYESNEGIFAFMSYRDPHVVSTLAVYEQAADFIINGSYAEEDVKGAILQACAVMDNPLSPAQEAASAFLRRTLGLSDKTRQRFKERLLKVNLAQVREAARRYFTPESLRERSIAVISSEEKLRASNEKLKEKLTLLKI